VYALLQLICAAGCHSLAITQAEIDEVRQHGHQMQFQSDGLDEHQQVCYENVFGSQIACVLCLVVKPVEQKTSLHLDFVSCIFAQHVSCALLVSLERFGHLGAPPHVSRSALLLFAKNSVVGNTG
jgi:hypothetical protein